jgi:hypothetical protein
MAPNGKDRAMTETPQQYTERILRYLRAENPLDIPEGNAHKDRPAPSETVENMVRMLAGHDLNHLRQIERPVAGTLR